MVHQHPALLPDMTVAENIRVAVGAEHLRRRRSRRCESDALAARRRALPRASRGSRLVAQRRSPPPPRDREGVRRVAATPDPRRANCAALAGFRRASLHASSASLRLTGRPSSTSRTGSARCVEIADRVTVLRDGTLRGTSAVKQISDADLLAMIVGRTLGATFPPKHTADADAAPNLRVEGLSGHGFENISLTAREGEIVGIAGVVGNGQPAFLRALAGRGPATGSVNVAGQELSRRASARERRLHAGRPADRGPDARPERA